jgi:GTP-binding protein
MGPLGDSPDDVATIVAELRAFSDDLATRERWLVLNKMDLVLPEECAARREAIINKLDWQGPVFEISALAGKGTDALVQAVMQHVEKTRAADADGDDGVPEPYA